MQTLSAQQVLLFLSALAVLSTLICTNTAQAGSGSVASNGDVSLNFHFRFPPVQSEINRVQEQLQRASALLCDATEGQMHIASARLSAGGASEPAGDIWYYPAGAIGRSRSSRAPLHNPANRFYLQYGGIRSDVLVHELSHLVFGIGDQYNEQRRFGDACGNGPAFDSPGLLNEINHTIMQLAGSQSCVTASAVRTSRSCFNDADCNAGETCPLPDLMSEFSVAVNNDALRGDGALAADTCPENRAGDTYSISGFLGATSTITAFDDTDFDTAKTSAAVSIAKEYIDEIGDVTAWDTGSAHPVWVFAERTATQMWTLHFGIDGEHLDEDEAGELEILGSVNIEFEATTSVTVMIPGGSDEQHRALERVDGVLLSDPGYTAPTITIPELANGADSVDLTVVFDELEERASRMGGSLNASNVLWGSFQQLGICGDTTACEQRWNTTTERWEASATTSASLQKGDIPLSDWERIVVNVQSNYELSLNAPSPVPGANPLPEHDCDAKVEFDVRVEGVDQVYLVMDRSGSMSDEREWLGTTKTRMEWAQAGARSFAVLMTGAGVEVGLISFSGFPTEHLDLRTVEPDGSGLSGVHEIQEVTNEIDDLEPDGATAIGDALEVARVRLEEAQSDGKTQVVMLLSDGAETAGVLTGAEVAAALADDGVIVYTVPLGNDADGELLASIADITGGEFYNATSPDDLPPLFAQLWGRMRGEAPIWAKVVSETVPFNDNFSATSHAIPVEEGSSRLSVMLSGRGEGAWDPTCTLVSPNGQLAIACSDPDFTENDEFYKIIRVLDPEPGTWTLQVTAFQQPIQRSYVWAHSDNDGPDCWAGTAPGFLEDEPGAGTWIRAVASYGPPLGRNVLYALSVETPNGTVLPLVIMDINDRRNGGEYLFTDFAGRGRYKILVTCFVTEESEFSPGEQPELLDILDDGNPVTFLRQARASFFLDSDDYPPMFPGDDDCDDNGTPNTAETDPLGDDDNDGVQNYCDTDDDNDDVPDTEDECPHEAESFDEGGVIDGCPDPDADGDGLIDSEERRLGTLVNNPDTDGDGLLDGEEVLVHRTNPLAKDTDGDGADDGLEIAHGYDPLDPKDTPPPGPSIPALSVLGRGLLFALLIGAGLWSARRRHRPHSA